MRQSLTQGSADSVPVTSLLSSASSCVSAKFVRFSPLATRHSPLSFCFHNVTNPFSRNSFIFTSIQNPRGVTLPRSFQEALRLWVSVVSAVCLSRQIPSFQQFAASCSLLPFFSALLSFVFSSLQTLFPKQGGWVGGLLWLTRVIQLRRQPQAYSESSQLVGGRVPLAFGFLKGRLWRLFGLICYYSRH
jgi:hypothetical protein